MLTLLQLLLSSLSTAVRSRVGLAAEILALRHQTRRLGASSPGRRSLTHWDRALWAFVLRRWSGWKDSLVLVKPQIVIAGTAARSASSGNEDLEPAVRRPVPRSESTGSS